MYDFCLTPIYAVLLAAGGLAGYVAKGSTVSLGAGVGGAALLTVCSTVSLQCYRKGALCKPATAVSLVVAAALTYIMGERYLATHKVMPGGAVAALSGVMVLFYAWSLVAGPKPKAKHPAKAK